MAQMRWRKVIAPRRRVPPRRNAVFTKQLPWLPAEIERDQRARQVEALDRLALAGVVRKVAEGDQHVAPVELVADAGVRLPGPVRVVAGADVAVVRQVPLAVRRKRDRALEADDAVVEIDLVGHAA